MALLEDVHPTKGPIDVRPVQGQRITGQVEGLETARGAAIKITRGSVYLFGRVNEDMTFSVDRVPPGPWRVELRRDYGVATYVERVEAGATGVRLVVDE